eukprot:824777-Pleurochrysis_carterae.AAC.1
MPACGFPAVSNGVCGNSPIAVAQSGRDPWTESPEMPNSTRSASLIAYGCYSRMSQSASTTRRPVATAS